MTIKLYHCRDARSFRVLWALEELGLPYALEVMPFPPRFRVEGYKDLNPLGTVPACFIDGALMTESAAIPHVLATRFGPSALAQSLKVRLHPWGHLRLQPDAQRQHHRIAE